MSRRLREYGSSCSGGAGSRWSCLAGRCRAFLSVVRATLGARHLSRRKLQLALAFFWLLDGALQLQPFMLTRGFAERVIAPSAGGQPASVAAMVHWATSLILLDPPVWDVLFAATQLAIGVALLFPRSVRGAVAASIAWSLGVWALGEGFGGLAGGRATFLTGAPGAVILYALLGLAAWPSFGPERRDAVMPASSHWTRRLQVLAAPAPDEPPARWVPAAWAGLWGLFALLRALPANDSSEVLATQLRANAVSVPNWAAHADRVLATAGSRGGTAVVAFVVALELAIGLLGIWPGALRRVGVAAGIAMAVAVWVLGQAFGQIPTGMGTDPSSAPLVALLGVALLGCVGGGRRVEERATYDVAGSLNVGTRAA